MSENFEYSYSAEKQSEIDAIRKKYLPPDEREEKLARLRKLDAGVTVPGQIDGWRQAEVSGLRLDYCLAGQPGRTLRSRVVFNGDFRPVVSDHFGVLTEEEAPSPDRQERTE